MTTTPRTKPRLSRRVEAMSESATIRMAQLARDLAAQGHDVISLSLGEPDFDTPEFIKAFAKDALDAGYTKYTPVPGLPELRQAIAEKFRRENGLDYALNEIVVSNGAKQTIANLALALLQEGDEAIIFAPYWVSYFEIVKMTGAEPVVVSAGIEQDYKVQPRQLAEAITPRTRMVIYSSPCNPTGSVYSREELEALAEVLRPHEDIVVVSDEIYEYITFGAEHVSMAALDGMRERTATVNGFAKGFAMTGWRLGYMGAPAFLAAACTKIQGQFTSGANAFSQKAAAEALRADRSATQEMKAAFRRRRDLVLELLAAIPGMQLNHPQGAFYIFPDISAFFGKANGSYRIQNSEDFCEYLLHEAHVAVVPGSAFGAERCFRLSYAASEEQLRTAIERMAQALARLR